jgi:hypothetical protein
MHTIRTLPKRDHSCAQLALFNRGITDSNRKTIATESSTFLGVTAPVPKTFEGIPVLNNLGSRFFDFERDRLPDGRDHVFVMAFIAASSYDATPPIKIRRTPMWGLRLINSLSSASANGARRKFGCTNTSIGPAQYITEWASLAWPARGKWKASGSNGNKDVIARTKS